MDVKLMVHHHVFGKGMIRHVTLMLIKDEFNTTGKATGQRSLQ